MKRWFIIAGAVALITACYVYAQCAPPYGYSYSRPVVSSYQQPTYISSYQIFREVTDLSAGIPSVSGHYPIGLIAATDGTIRIRDKTGVEVNLPLQAGFVQRVRPVEVLPGGTLNSIVVVYW